jgi:GNAT superfamily N-acetyltransferase
MGHGNPGSQGQTRVTRATDIRRATVADLGLLVPLFDAYRVFYGKPSDTSLARTFLSERLQRNQSVVFLAFHSQRAAGFTQLYPSFSSVSAARIFILNDLFVAPEARRSGVAGKLLEAAASFGRTEGAVRLALSTAVDNEPAQALYASRGWVRDTKFHVYTLAL